MILQSLEKSTQIKIFFSSSFLIYMCSYLFHCLLHTSIINNCAATWTLSIIHGKSIKLFILATILIVLPEDSMVMLY